MNVPVVRLGAGDAEVTAAVHAADAPGVPFLLTHGAGGDRDGAGLVALAEALAARGHPVVRANLPYREAGRPVPPRAERMLASFAAIVASARQVVADDRAWIVGGRSYGGRVASLAVAEGSVPSAGGLLLCAYPLHPPGRPQRLRVDHWPAIALPTLVLQGTHDPFGGDEEVGRNLDRLGGPATLVAVPGGDHSLAVPASRAEDGRRHGEAEVLAGLADQIARWAAEAGAPDAQTPRS